MHLFYFLANFWTFGCGDHLWILTFTGGRWTGVCLFCEADQALFQGVPAVRPRRPPGCRDVVVDDVDRFWGPGGHDLSWACRPGRRPPPVKFSPLTSHGFVELASTSSRVRVQCRGSLVFTCRHACVVCRTCTRSLASSGTTKYIPDENEISPAALERHHRGVRSDQIS